jgi:hypothetical protein
MDVDACGISTIDASRVNIRLLVVGNRRSGDGFRRRAVDVLTGTNSISWACCSRETWLTKAMKRLSSNCVLVGVVSAR